MNKGKNKPISGKNVNLGSEPARIFCAYLQLATYTVLLCGEFKSPPIRLLHMNAAAIPINADNAYHFAGLWRLITPLTIWNWLG